MEALQATNNQKYPDLDSLRHGYLHFEALSSHEYTLSCVNCGDHPSVVVMDLHKKGVFSMPGEWLFFHISCGVCYTVI